MKSNKRLHLVIGIILLISGVAFTWAPTHWKRANAQIGRMPSQDAPPEVRANAVTLGGPVHTIVVAPNGDVYAGGSFTNGTGDSDIDFIARWDGAAWHPLGKGLTPNDGSSGVLALAIDGTYLYVGGNFLSTGDGVELNNFARWNMTTNAWEPLQYPCTHESGLCGPGITTGYVFALATSLKGSGVFVGGKFQPPYLANEFIRNIGFYDGAQWSPLGSGLYEGDVYALHSDSISGDLYVGGARLVSYDEIGAGNLRRWDGSAWHAIKDAPSFEQRIVDIDGMNGSIYVGGYFQIQTATSGTGTPTYAYSVAKWDGSEWAGLGNNPIGDTPANVFAVGVSANNVYAGGAFIDERPGTACNLFAEWNGQSWGNAGASLDSTSRQYVSAITVSNGQVYVGGFFANAGGNPDADYIARYDGTNWYALVNVTPATNP